jgi:plastocyanin
MLAAAAACAAALSLPALVAAAPVRGTVSLPSSMKTGRRHQGYWRIENGNVPVAPAPYRGDTVVVLEGMKGAAPSAKTLTVEISGLQVSTPLVVVGPGSVIELKNNDKVPHDLGIPESPNVMPVERLAANQVRRARFSEPGAYLVRCAEYPHISLSVIVVGSPNFAVVDEKGAFKIADAPDGKGTLKVWSRGRWVHDEPIEVSGKPLDTQVKVTGTEARDHEHDHDQATE